MRWRKQTRGAKWSICCRPKRWSAIGSRALRNCSSKSPTNSFLVLVAARLTALLDSLASAAQSQAMSVYGDPTGQTLIADAPPSWLAGMLDLGRPLVMGILNCTPDSFFDGGRFVDPGNAIDQAEAVGGTGRDTTD